MVIMCNAEAALGKGETIVAILSTEPGEAWNIACFTATKEGFEGQINAYGNVLQYLGMHSAIVIANIRYNDAYQYSSLPPFLLPYSRQH